MKAQDKKTPDSVQAKINKVTNYGGYAKGGYVRAADGCATRGKTKGRIV